jgi:fatty acid CoA ligase FadD9
VLLREAHARFGLPVANFRSDMILAHSRYRGQLNVPDIFTRWVFSIARTGLAPRSFYTPRQGVRPHYDGLPVDFTASSIVEIGERQDSGFQTYHVVNPHDDGISMNEFVDWIAQAGHPVERIPEYEDWLQRFETALKCLPEHERQQSFLPLLHQLRSPMPAAAGAHVAAPRFRAAVRAANIGPAGDIPHLSAELIKKYVEDLESNGVLS